MTTNSLSPSNGVRVRSIDAQAQNAANCAAFGPQRQRLGRAAILPVLGQSAAVHHGTSEICAGQLYQGLNRQSWQGRNCGAAQTQWCMAIRPKIIGRAGRTEMKFRAASMAVCADCGRRRVLGSLPAASRPKNAARFPWLVVRCEDERGALACRSRSQARCRAVKSPFAAWCV